MQTHTRTQTPTLTHRHTLLRRQISLWQCPVTGRRWSLATLLAGSKVSVPEVMCCWLRPPKPEAVPCVEFCGGIPCQPHHIPPHHSGCGGFFSPSTSKTPKGTDDILY
ncbi:hypothetical protein AALO_G00174860 [Alosa alosa]|uniref:Uncharacterized protein n=1 Tax=Alosa alosa TaxID=278164 RepID=A0AAV6GC99_9TELE|nr:hypothetical protein AALO_G00174860 [Alosa alosa]